MCRRYTAEMTLMEMQLFEFCLKAFPSGSFPQCVGDRCEKCTKSGRAAEENLVGLAGEQAFSSL